ncbi:MAG: Ppx/GppA phosphatase family protein [Myxococcaceae bacterium]|nr:Ppx/GppA phosphatase family protein [Myxococcaceae bacterium]
MPSRRSPDARGEVLAAIDVGTNAVRLELARALPDGSLETLHTERDPVRPGEGLFTTGVIAKDVAGRLVATLRRYASVCKRHGAQVRAVATSALREAKNRDEIVRRVKRDAGLTLEVVSGREEARLICLGVLTGKPAHQRSVCIDLGGGSTEIISAEGEQPKDLWSVDIGAVRMTELFDVRGTVPKRKLTLMRSFARELMEESIPYGIRGLPTSALGSSGTIGAIVAYARSEGVGHASLLEISRTVEELADLDLEKRRKRFDPRRADIITAGAVILESVMKHLKVQTITAVDRGLREGVLVDLVRRKKQEVGDHSLADAALAVGRRFGFGEAHARQVARLSLALFDGLAAVHKLPASARPYLEAAALLHDVGHAVNYQRHHKHAYYLITNVDLPGLSDRERQLVATIARFHRRSKPEVSHELMKPFTPAEARMVRKCATLLRVADALDRSHHQPVQKLQLASRGNAVFLKVKARQAVDLELWDVAHEVGLFREVFARALLVTS